MLGDDVVQRDIALGDGGGYHVAAGLDLIRDDRVVTAVQLLDAVDFDDIRTGAMYICAHHVQEVGKVNDVRLTRDVFKDRSAFSQNGRQHSVHRRADGDCVKKHMAADKVIRLDMDLTVLHRILGPEGVECLQVLVDGARTQVTSARHGDLPCPKAAQQCAKEVVAGTHLARQLIGDFGAVNMRRIDLIGAAADHADAGT